MSLSPTDEYISDEVEQARFRFDVNLDEYINPSIIRVDREFIAKTNIPKGTLLYSSLPCITYTERIRKTIRLQCVLGRMSEDDLESLDLLLRDHYPATNDELKTHFNNIFPGVTYPNLRLIDIIDFKIKANKIRRSSSQSDMCVYKSIFSHSCNPNCFDIIRKCDSVIRIYNIRDIPLGEVCSICYDDRVLYVESIDQRRDILLKSRYMYCSCSFCNSGIDQEYYTSYLADIMTVKDVWMN